jgi:hypothetical protein
MLLGEEGQEAQECEIDIPSAALQKFLTGYEKQREKGGERQVFANQVFMLG